MDSKARSTVPAEEAGSAGGRPAGCPGGRLKDRPCRCFRIAALPALHPAPEKTMDIYQAPDPDRFAQGGSGSPPLGEAWRRCCDRLRAEVGDAVFSSWFGSLTLESVGSGQARLSVPTRFLKSWIVTHYSGHVASALNAEVGPVAQVLISVRSSAPLAQCPPAGCASPVRAALKPVESSGARAFTDSRAPARTPAPPAASEALTGSPLDRRLTFATF